MLYQQLKERTQPAHHALEKDLVVKIRRVASTDDYLDLLKLMYGFYAAIESKVQNYLADDSGIDFRNRRKSDWLLRDISRFGDAQNLKLCGDLPAINSAAGAIGAMYVLEGSTLGGAIIARMIKGQLSMEGSEGVEFFQSYGHDTQRMWDRFKENLSKPFNETEREEIVGIANDTFITFRNWIERHAAN